MEKKKNNNNNAMIFVYFFPYILRTRTYVTGVNTVYDAESINRQIEAQGMHRVQDIIIHY